MAENFANTPQYPSNFVGPAGQQGFFGVATINIMGSGMVRDTLGIPGLKATLVGTGTYSLSFPAVRNTSITASNSPSGTYPTVQGVKIFPALVGGSGAQHLSAKLSTLNSGSGTAQMRVTDLLIGASGAAGVPSGFAMPRNAPSGTSIDLQVIVTPITPY